MKKRRWGIDDVMCISDLNYQGGYIFFKSFLFTNILVHEYVKESGDLEMLDSLSHQVEDGEEDDDGETTGTSAKFEKVWTNYSCS